MTNEEKARQLANYFAGETDNESAAYAYSAAMVMAQWKDEQIDTIMLTTEGCLRSFFESQGNTKESIDNFIDALKTQINENLNKL